MSLQATLINYHNGIWYELVFNETMAMLNKDGNVFISFPPELNNWKIRLVFQDNAYNSLANIQTEFDANEIVLKLTNWYSDTGIQNQEPLLLQSRDGKLSLLAVIKAIGNRFQNQRGLTISIWKKVTQ
jgi:hypothetical protein